MPSASTTTEEAGDQAMWKMLFQNQECQLPKVVFNLRHLDDKQLTNDDITGSTDHLFRLSDEITRWQICLDILIHCDEYEKAGGGEDFVVVSFCFVLPRESNCLLGFSDSDPHSSRKLTSCAENSRSTISFPV